MHHAVPAPSLPPDADDLYSPPPNLRVGQMANLVWSVMRLSSTTPDYAWCTVCRKWYRYRIDFNAAYIKTLFKHCKTQHRIAADSTLQPVSAAPQHFPSPPPPPPPPPRQPAQPHTASLIDEINKYRAKKNVQADLIRARAQAVQAQAAMLGHAQSPTFPGIHPPSPLPRSPPAPLSVGPTPAASSSMQGGNIPPTLITPQIATAIAHLQRQSAAHGQIISQTQALQILRHVSQQRAMHMRRAAQMSPAALQQQHQRQMLPRQTGQMNREALQQALRQNSNGTAVVSSPPVMLPSANNSNLTGVAVAQNSPPNIPQQSAPAQPSNLYGGASKPPAPPQPMAQAPAETRPPTRSNTNPPPLQGSVTKRMAKRKIIPMVTTVTRCELTDPVLKVAERSQDLIFNGAALFFTEAVFKVPSTEKEAIDTMKTGTTDVDKDEGKTGSGKGVNDLYFLSWSHTQFFAAQMAALGYRFLSSNLRRKALKTKPPPVTEWLRLEKYQSVPRSMVQAGAMTSQKTTNVPQDHAPSVPHPQPEAWKNMNAMPDPPRVAVPNQTTAPNGIPSQHGQSPPNATTAGLAAPDRPPNNSSIQEPSNSTPTNPTQQSLPSEKAVSHPSSAIAAPPPPPSPTPSDVQIIDLT